MWKRLIKRLFYCKCSVCHKSIRKFDALKFPHGYALGHEPWIEYFCPTCPIPFQHRNNPEVLSGEREVTFGIRLCYHWYEVGHGMYGDAIDCLFCSKSFYSEDAPVYRMLGRLTRSSHSDLSNLTPWQMTLPITPKLVYQRKMQNEQTKKA